MLHNLAVFIFPQFSLHRHLERIIKSVLDNISNFIDFKSVKYLNFTITDNLEERQVFLSELKTLNQMIEQTEVFLTWPFNYNQVATLLISLLFNVILLIIEILFIL